MRWLAIALCACTTALAQAPYPAKPLRYIIPESPGGGSDVIGRIFAEGLADVFGQPVMVDNRPGAGTTIGIAVGAKAAPDGYTITQNGSGFAAGPSLYRTLPYDPVRDFAHVTLLAKAPYALVVHPSIPVRSVKALVALAQGKPGALNYASAGTGAASYFAAETFKEKARINVTHVPYRGGGPALTAVLAGEVSVYFAPVAAAAPYFGNRLRVLAVTTLQCLPLMPDMPTVAESGYAGYESGNWYGLLLPVGASGDVVIALHRAAISTLGKVNKRLTELAYITIGSSPAEYAAYVATEVKNTAATYQRLGLKPN